MSESVARTICQWTDELPEDCRPAADAILVTAAKAGMDLRDLSELAAEIYERSRPDVPDQDPAQAFEDRAVRLESTFQGAGVLNGDLTPECTAVVTAVLDALSAPACAEDTRTHAERYHDALHEAMRRLVAAGLLPERAGQPVKVWAHISLADLMMLDGSSALMEEWTAGVRAQWAAHRAGASMGGSDGAAWLDGDAAQAIACDASVAPVVTGDVNPAALDDLVRLCVELDRVRRCGDGAQGTPAPDTTRAWEALEQAVIGQAVDLLSGPGGLASFLRRRQLGVRLGGPSLPLDIGVSSDIPAAIRRAVILRDQHCRFPGGCDQPAAACEVHHLTHKADGGKTSVKDCALFCCFHHQVVIHQWGWAVVLNPDGTTTAWNKDKTRTKPRSSTATAHPPGLGKAHRLGQAGQALQVDAGDAADLDEGHQHDVAGAAADHGTGPVQVHRELGHLADRTARAAGADGRGHLGAEDLDQQPADRIAVQGRVVQGRAIHHRPPFASTKRGSLPRRAEPFCLDPLRRIPQPDQAARDRLHEVRRPAGVRQRPVGHRPGHVGQHLFIHPPRVARPPRRLRPGQRVEHGNAVRNSRKLGTVDHLVPAPRGIQQPHLDRAANQKTVPQDGP
jgi:hypothetical protein